MTTLFNELIDTCSSVGDWMKYIGAFSNFQRDVLTPTLKYVSLFPAAWSCNKATRLRDFLVRHRRVILIVLIILAIIAMAVALPYMIVGFIQALGFGSGGVIAGMMPVGCTVHY